MTSADKSMSQKRLKVIIDADTGIDDSHAILMALAHPNIDVLAITCVNGNVNADLVCENTLRVLKACNREDVPIFKGAEASLMGYTSEFENFSGEVWNTPVDTSNMSSEHAANALVRIINMFPDEVTVVALAPLTNLALAARLDSTLHHKIKELFIMGGNIEARGRINLPGGGGTSSCAEFNFFNDPEAAKVVLKEFENITVLPYEPCCNCLLTWDFYDLWTNGKTKVSEFVKRSTSDSIKARASGRQGYKSCDGYAMASVIDRSVVKSSQSVYATVELHGQLTRGQMIVDWYNVMKKPSNVTVVKELDMKKIEDLFMLMVR